MTRRSIQSSVVIPIDTASRATMIDEQKKSEKREDALR
jgi:hypothetical protein